MFSKRLELLKKKHKNDDDIEEMNISDSEINEVFQLDNKKNTKKNKTTKSSTLKDNKKKEPELIKESELIKEKTPIKESQIYNRNNYESDEELNEILAKPVTKRRESFEHLLKGKIKSKDKIKPKNKINENKNNDDDIICLSDNESNEVINCADDDDDCIDLGCVINTKSTRSRRRRLNYAVNKSPTLVSNLIINSTSNLTPVKPSNSSFNSTFDVNEFQLDPSVYASLEFVKEKNIKFKFKGSYYCVTFKSNDKFKDKLEDISRVLKINSNSMLLMFKDKLISFENTTEELNIGICDIIDVYEKNNQNEENDNDNEDPNLFRFKFRDSDSRRKVEDTILTMNRYDTFEQIFKKYAQLKEIDLNRLIFEFDGEKIELDQKPDDLDMESDYLIDVRTKKY